jgi:hypothetical protein
VSGIIKTGVSLAKLWPGIKLIFEASYDPEKAAEREAVLALHRKPLTRWQKFKRPFVEAQYRVRVAVDILRKGDSSVYLGDY